MANIEKRSNGVWRARYCDDAGKQHARYFPRKVDAKAWIDTVTASVVRGDYTDPKTARTTVEQWCATWLKGYATRRASTVRQARVHIAQINKASGPMRLADVRPSQMKAWTAQLKAANYADSTGYATYRRFAQIMGDAVQDGIIPRSPCSRKTSPGGERSGTTWPRRSRSGRCMTRWTSTFGLSGEDRIIRDQEDADRLLEVTRTEIAMQEATVDRLVREYRAKCPDSKVIDIE